MSNKKFTILKSVLLGILSACTILINMKIVWTIPRDMAIISVLIQLISTTCILLVVNFKILKSNAMPNFSLSLVVFIISFFLCNYLIWEWGFLRLIFLQGISPELIETHRMGAGDGFLIIFFLFSEIVACFFGAIFAYYSTSNRAIEKRQQNDIM